ncbi:hypothetical protein J6590_026092 [Homalodisca vitripennis]|nr:hypothetical protein J6590_026092 [Homalodisca vitripennis]
MHKERDSADCNDVTEARTDDQGHFRLGESDLFSPTSLPFGSQKTRTDRHNDMHRNIVAGLFESGYSNCNPDYGTSPPRSWTEILSPDMSLHPIPRTSYSLTIPLNIADLIYWRFECHVGNRVRVMAALVISSCVADECVETLTLDPDLSTALAPIGRESGGARPATPTTVIRLLIVRAPGSRFAAKMSTIRSGRERPCGRAAYNSKHSS